jgi:hypothetical protein
MKTCSKCGTDKPRDCFNRAKRSADGFQPWCRDCTRAYTSRWSKNNPERRNASARARYAANPAPHVERSRRVIVKRKYGLTLEEYEAIIGKGCAICGRQGPSGPGGMALDHCHTTGKIRAALCTNCNQGLGQFFDDPVRLRVAADYLEKRRSSDIETVELD